MAIRLRSRQNARMPLSRRLFAIAAGGFGVAFALLLMSGQFTVAMSMFTLACAMFVFAVR